MAKYLIFVLLKKHLFSGIPINQMSARKDRLPSGRNNLSESNSSSAILTSRVKKTSRNESGRKQDLSLPPSPIKMPNMSARLTYNDDTQSMHSSTGSLKYQKLKERNRNTKAEQEELELQSLGSYNTYSRPLPSVTMPLRTSFLDPNVNNFIRSKTRTELIQRIFTAAAPHPSYDVDGDGWVSQKDYQIAKRFDLNNDGILDAEERELTKEMIVEDFIKENDSGLKAIGALGGKLQKLEKTLRSSDIHKNLTLPETMSTISRAKFSLKMSTRELLTPADEDAAGTKTQRFFTNKLDSTAWNDYDAVPRFTSTFGLEDHGGSCRRMLFSRKQKNAEVCQSKLEESASVKPTYDTRRVNLITDSRYENS